MDLRFFLALLVAKTTKFIINLTGGGATAAPGYFSLFIDSDILKKLSMGLEKTIVITGTNGKTTTSRLIGDFLEKTGVRYIHNRHGSNLERGLVSAFLDQTDFFGKLKTKTALFEVDEAALGNVILKLSPSALVITNLFRDQLDRYGEIDNIKKLWEKCVANLDQETALVLNTDDPSVAFLGAKVKCKLLYFGVEDQKIKLEDTPQTVDSIKCPNCYSDLKYNSYYLSHLGNYYCASCRYLRPDPDVFVKNIKLKLQGSEFELKDTDGISFDLQSPLAGIYNIYNCLAAYSTLKALRFDLDQFPIVVNKFKPVFGRSEKLSLEGRNIIVALAKNPTGFNEVIRTFLDQDNQTVLIVINDRIADGRDVSWLWDVDFEKLDKFQNYYVVSGVRGSDMGLRLKYAGIKDYVVEENLEEALQKGLDRLPQNATLTIIPTYTAMLELKKIFAKKGIGGEFWED